MVKFKVELEIDAVNLNNESVKTIIKDLTFYYKLPNVETYQTNQTAIHAVISVNISLMGDS
jgi:hypothetical protein